MTENSAAKRAIADAAIELFQPGETLFVDTGSTTLYFAERLTELSDITVVTNSTEIARVIDAVHGNLMLAPRPGSASGIMARTKSLATVAFPSGK